MLDHEPSTWDSVALLCGNEPFRMRQNEITARVYAPVRVQSSLNWGKCVTPNLSLDWSPRSGLRACYTTRSLTGGIGGFNGTHPGAFLNKHWLVSESSRHRWWHPVGAFSPVWYIPTTLLDKEKKWCSEQKRLFEHLMDSFRKVPLSGSTRTIWVD